MLRILVFIAIASAFAFGAVWLAERPGEVSVVWGAYTIETTVAMAAIGVVLLVLFSMLLWTMIRFLLGLPTAFSFASRARTRARGFDAVSRGMVAIGAGDPAAARRHANDARKLISSEPLTLLLSAQAAQLSGDKPAADAAFRQMLDEPATRVLGLRGLFVEARRRGDQIAARAFADEAVRLSPSLAWANDALLEFHSTAGDWAQARIAVERRAALRLSDKTESKRHRAVLLAAEAEVKADADPANALSAALDALKLAPGLTPAAVLAGRMLSAKGDLRKAARLLETAWREQPHPDLANVYVHMRLGDSAGDRLVKAEALMKLKPTDPESAFAVADAAIEARDFAKARGALSPLLAAIATVRSCLLMARIEDAEHGSAGRAREWLTRSTRAPRDNAWVADGMVSEKWLPVSPASGRLDAFAWTLPPAVLGSAVPPVSDWATEASRDIDLHEPVMIPPPTAAMPEPVRAEPPDAAVPLLADTTSVVLPAASQMALVSTSMQASAQNPAMSQTSETSQRRPWYASIMPASAPPETAAQQKAELPAEVTGLQDHKHSLIQTDASTTESTVASPPRLPDDPGTDPAPTAVKSAFWRFGAR
ncbi:MAG: heme biosynthesis HemY N-terminal domain-containing protein [Bosea sp. (in: a-proteobacteria)]